MEYRTSRPLSSSCRCGSTKLMLQINKPGNMSWFDRWRWLLRKHLRFQMKRRPCQCYSCLNYSVELWIQLVYMHGTKMQWICIIYIYIWNMYSKNRIYVAILIIINLYYYIEFLSIFITHPNPLKKTNNSTLFFCHIIFPTCSRQFWRSSLGWSIRWSLKWWNPMLPRVQPSPPSKPYATSGVPSDGW